VIHGEDGKGMDRTNGTVITNKMRSLFNLQPNLRYDEAGGQNTDEVPRVEFWFRSAFLMNRVVSLELSPIHRIVVHQFQRRVGLLGG